MRNRPHLSFEQCSAIAREYDSRGEFALGARAAYARALKNQWLDAICAHMRRRIAPNGHWNLQRCAEAASAFSTRSEFARAMPGCYTQAGRKGFLDTICAHMTPNKNAAQRWVYVVACDVGRRVYVGISYDVQRRERAHRRGWLSTQFDSFPEVRTISGPHDPYTAARLESAAIDEFRQSGWQVLNRARGGALGGTRRKWTKSRCIQEAAKFTRLVDFMRQSQVAYGTARMMGWADEVCAHLSLSMTLHGTWTKERCAECAKLCATRAEFRRRFGVARQIAQRNRWMDEICAHMEIARRPNGYWSRQGCCRVAAECSTPMEFRRLWPGAYDAAHRNGWLTQVYACVSSSLKATEGTRNEHAV